MSEINSNENSNFFKSSLLQIIPVMLGVFLGLLANNWNEERQSKQLETKVLQKIKEDISSNKKQLENVLEYHKSLADSAKAIFQIGSLEYLTATRFEARNMKGNNNFWKGTRTGTLRDAGYQTAIVSGALAKMDIELVSTLSEIHKAETHFNQLANNYLQNIINQNSETKVMDYLQFALTFSMDISIAEESLIELYNDALTKF